MARLMLVASLTGRPPGFGIVPGSHLPELSRDTSILIPYYHPNLTYKHNRLIDNSISFIHCLSEPISANLNSKD